MMKNLDIRNAADAREYIAWAKKTLFSEVPVSVSNGSGFTIILDNDKMNDLEAIQAAHMIFQVHMTHSAQKETAGRILH